MSESSSLPVPAALPASPLKPLHDFVWLLWSEFFIIRYSWFWHLVQLALYPLGYLAFLWLLLGRQGPEAMLFAVTGSWVTAIGLGTMLTLGQQIGGLKDAHAFEYYATLPISKAVYLGALTTRSVVLTLPPLLTLMAIGHVAFGFSVPPAGVAVLVLSAYSMAGFGALIGFWSPTGQVANNATQLLQTIITFLAPVFMPLEALPGPLRVTSMLWPTTHAAIALRAAMAGEPLTAYWVPVAALAGFALLSFGLVPLKLEWRSR